MHSNILGVQQYTYTPSSAFQTIQCTHCEYQNQHCILTHREGERVRENQLIFNRRKSHFSPDALCTEATAQKKCNRQNWDEGRKKKTKRWK